MDTEAFINVICEGSLSRGTSARFSHVFGNWLPGDPEEVLNFRVYIDNGKERLDITNFLTEKERSKLETDYLEEMLVEYE